MIGKGDLVFRLAAVFQAQWQVFGVNERDNSVELGLRANIVIHKECLGDRNRISQTRSFHQNRIKAAGAAHQAFHHTDQVTAHGAADATIVHFIDFFVGFHNQIIVDTDLAEFIDDHCIFLAMVFGQNAVQKRGFARAQIPCQNGYWNGLCSLGFGHGSLFGRWNAQDLGWLTVI